MVNPCCMWLESMLESAGEQGLGVVAVHQGDRRRFQLQARALTTDQARQWEVMAREPSLEPLFRNAQGRLVSIQFIQGVPLQYCPHCGADLNALIASNTTAFDTLARNHAVFRFD